MSGVVWFEGMPCGVCDDVHQTMYKMPRIGKYEHIAYEKKTYKDGIAKFKSCVYMFWHRRT